MPGRYPVGHRTHRAGAGPNFRQPRQSIYQSDTTQTPALPLYGMQELAGTRPDTKYPYKSAEHFQMWLWPLEFFPDLYTPTNA